MLYYHVEKSALDNFKKGSITKNAIIFLCNVLIIRRLH
jgi:hypothetical protein